MIYSDSFPSLSSLCFLWACSHKRRLITEHILIINHFIACINGFRSPTVESYYKTGYTYCDTIIVNKHYVYGLLIIILKQMGVEAENSSFLS